MIPNRNQFYVNEQIRKVYERDNYTCICGARANQIAHLISKSKVNIKKYGKDIIHHALNLRAVCGLSCNSAVLISDVKTKQIEDQVRKIKRNIKNENR